MTNRFMFKRIARLATLAAVLAGFATACETTEPSVDYEATIVPRSASVSSDDGSVFVEITAKGDWTVELKYPSGTEAWATMDPASGSGNMGNARLRYSQNTSEDSRSVTLALKMSGREVSSATVYQEAAGGNQIIGDPGDGAFAAGWLELPETKAGDGRVALVHDMSGEQYVNEDVSGTRNYTCYWDYDAHLSFWVAYPLNGALAGNSKFDYVWGFDPLLPSSMQPNITLHSYGGKAFGGGNWNRGHQMPRADRQTSQKAVASTCYPTNMTPQDGSFNSGIWRELENAVRDFAGKSDTTYVVTGCVWDKSTTYTQPYSDSQFAVIVPNAYFKALLFRSIYNPKTEHYIYADETKGFMAVAYYLPHDTAISGNPYLNYIMSVDDLEKMLGVDLFVNLPGEIGVEMADKVESEINSFWK